MSSANKTNRQKERTPIDQSLYPPPCPRPASNLQRPRANRHGLQPQPSTPCVPASIPAETGRPDRPAVLHPASGNPARPDPPTGSSQGQGILGVLGAYRPGPHPRRRPEQGPGHAVHQHRSQSPSHQSQRRTQIPDPCAQGTARRRTALRSRRQHHLCPYRPR